MIRLLSLAFLIMIISGCAGTISSAAGNTAFFYEMSPEEADNLVASVMASEFAGSPISRVEFPNKGYQATIRFALDSHTIVAYYIPANGAEKTGYVFEVNHSGTMPLSGGNRAKSVFSKIIERAETFSSPVALSGYGH